MGTYVDLKGLRHGTDLLKRGFARMQQGGVIMDVVTPEQAQIAEDAGACAVMALERVPADIRAQGGVARMSHPDLIDGIIETTSIPVMAKARIGHEAEARVLESLGVDMIDESEVLTPADPFYHIDKQAFTVPFVCGSTHLGEAVRRIHEGAAMIRTKGEAGTGNVVAAVTHARLIQKEIATLSLPGTDFAEAARRIAGPWNRLDERVTENIGSSDWSSPFGGPAELQHGVKKLLEEIRDLDRLPVVTFTAGGIATPADAAMMMRMGMDGVFVGSGIFKSEAPAQMAESIVLATSAWDDPATVAEASRMTGGAMRGIELEAIPEAERLAVRGW